MTRERTTWGLLGASAPIAVFGVVYVLTCLVGAVMLILDYRPFIGLWEYFSGSQAPDLRGGTLGISVVLLVVPPILLGAGYWLGLRLPIAGARAGRSRSAAPRGETIHPSSGWAPGIVFSLLALVGLVSLARSGGFAHLDAWLSYQAWVDARWAAFASMSFFEFVNIYTFVPLAAAWCALSGRGGSIRGRLARWVPAAVAVLMALALFQKKAALISLIIVLAVVLLDVARRSPSRARRGIVAGAAALTVIYFVMVVVPTFNLAVHVDPAVQRGRAALVTPKPRPTVDATGASPQPLETGAPGASVVVPAATAGPEAPQVDPRLGVAIYAFLAPLMRTSAPALYYPIVFPEAHPYYGPDVGLDIVCSRRIGCFGRSMPDDNLVVWDYMNPALRGGSVAAPFQFALYSQAGLAAALIGALVLGVALALAWRVALSAALSPTLACLWGACVIVLAINLAIDSPRNSIVVSYGALWGFVFVAAIALALRLLHRSEATPRLVGATQAR